MIGSLINFGLVPFMHGVLCSTNNAHLNLKSWLAIHY